MPPGGCGRDPVVRPMSGARLTSSFEARCPRAAGLRDLPSDRGIGQIGCEVGHREHRNWSRRCFPTCASRCSTPDARRVKKAEGWRASPPEADILVATSVVEVGVDVPNATVMIVEGARRLAWPSCTSCAGGWAADRIVHYCLLFEEAVDEEGSERLRAVGDPERLSTSPSWTSACAVPVTWPVCASTSARDARRRSSRRGPGRAGAHCPPWPGWSTTRRSRSTRPSMRRCTATARLRPGLIRRGHQSHNGGEWPACSPPHADGGAPTRRDGAPGPLQHLGGRVTGARMVRSLRRCWVARVRGAQPGAEHVTFVDSARRACADRRHRAGRFGCEDRIHW